MSTTDISNTEDYLDIRDIIEAIEADENMQPELVELLSKLKGCGSNHQWKGDWYPLSLIRDSYFEEYAYEYAESIGAIDSNSRWPNNCIDWEKATRELQMDYLLIEYDGVNYWYR